MVERMVNIVCAVIAAVLFAVPIIAVVAAILLLDGRPVFFRQSRVGLRGRAFTIYKFRTMRNGKVTRVGAWLRRLSVDELPQLLNVICGDMNIVGPRAVPKSDLPEDDHRCCLRATVRPGITGLAQISGRNSLSVDEKLSLDVFYVQNRSLWLDAWICFRTVIAEIY